MAQNGWEETLRLIRLDPGKIGVVLGAAAAVDADTVNPFLTGSSELCNGIKVPQQCLVHLSLEVFWLR
jgi:hypothetical protein